MDDFDDENFSRMLEEELELAGPIGGGEKPPQLSHGGAGETNVLGMGSAAAASVAAGGGGTSDHGDATCEDLDGVVFVSEQKTQKRVELAPAENNRNKSETTSIKPEKKIYKRPARKRNRGGPKGAATAPKSDAGGVPVANATSSSVALIDQEQLWRASTNKKAGSSGVRDLNAGERETCPPHPGFLRGLCIRCGELQDKCGVAEAQEQMNQKTISMRYLHSDLVINKEYVREMKEREATRLIAQKKLSLVFDLDHTLLNSSHIKDITEAKELPLLNEAVEKETKQLKDSPNKNGGRRSLFFLPHIQMWTKLRPYYLKLLEEASKLFDMHVYTMGERGYAIEMVKLLDPDRSFFGDHVVSKNDSTSNSVKDLDVLIGSEKSVLILDDSPKVWHRHRANVLEVERYHFFPSSLKHFGIRGKCLLHRKHDEDADCGPLSSVLHMLKEIHQEYFSHENPGQNDVREILKQKKKKVLVGCKICFSRVFPKGEEKPEHHPLWKVAEEFGAICTRFLDDTVSHVVTTSAGTEKAIQAKKMGILVVRPEWLYASVYHFKRSPEKRYNLVGETDRKTDSQKQKEEGQLEEGEIET